MFVTPLPAELQAPVKIRYSKNEVGWAVPWCPDPQTFGETSGEVTAEERERALNLFKLGVEAGGQILYRIDNIPWGDGLRFRDIVRVKKVASSPSLEVTGVVRRTLPYAARISYGPASRERYTELAKLAEGLEAFVEGAGPGLLMLNAPAAFAVAVFTHQGGKNGMLKVTPLQRAS